MAALSISSVPLSNPLSLPTLSAPVGTNVRPNSDRPQEPVQLSNQAKQKLAQSAQTPLETAQSEDRDNAGKESVQVSSSIGRLSRITGLQREEVAALYRSIDKLT